MFGRDGDVQTVQQAYRYHLAARLALKNWGEHKPLPELFAQVQRELIRQPQKGAKRQPWQPLAPREPVVHEVLGMVSKHDGEFKLWQREWVTRGPPPAFASRSIDAWVSVSESAIGDTQVHSQLRRGPGHTFSAIGEERPEDLDLDKAWSTVEGMIISLPQLFLMKIHDFSADAMYNHWKQAETIIAAKPRSVQGGTKVASGGRLQQLAAMHLGSHWRREDHTKVMAAGQPLARWVPLHI